MLNAVQGALDFKGCRNRQFNRSDGLGRVGVAGFATGLVFGVHLSIAGCCLVVNGPTIGLSLQWSLYACSLSFFHFAEFFVTAVFKPCSVSYNSFLLNHSKEYTMAILASWLEFWLEAFLFPGIKRQPTIIGIGVCLVVLGHSYRIGAMWTAGSNFNHEIMEKREASHHLVTHGIYSYCRHPSYFGWFWWSLGTQLILCNLLCFLCYGVTTNMFFYRRIPYEEALLEEFYPDQYPAYAQRTFVGIPFVSGRRKQGQRQARKGEGVEEKKTQK